MSSPRRHRSSARTARRGGAGLRVWLSAVLVALMLFSRLAVAAYACPGQAGLQDRPAMTPCAEMLAADMVLDPQQPLLCQQHCQAGLGEQSGASQALTAAALPAPPLWVLLPAAAPDLSAQSLSGVLSPAQARPPPAPLRTLLCCLRA